MAHVSMEYVWSLPFLEVHVFWNLDLKKSLVERIGRKSMNIHGLYLMWSCQLSLFFCAPTFQCWAECSRSSTSGLQRACVPDVLWLALLFSTNVASFVRAFYFKAHQIGMVWHLRKIFSTKLRVHVFWNVTNLSTFLPLCSVTKHHHFWSTTGSTLFIFHKTHTFHIILKAVNGSHRLDK